MKKLLVIFLGTGLIVLLAWVIASSSIHPISNSGSTIASVANWASQATTVADEVAEANLVVHTKVTKVNPSRKLKQVGPRYTFSGKVDENGVNIMPFTDSEMAVLS